MIMNFVVKIVELLLEFIDAMWTLIKISLWVIVPIALFGGIIVGCNQIPYFKQRNEEMKQKRVAEETPHIIHEVDGCKVYAFKVGTKYHYFTRCPKETTTDTTIEERHGKHTTYETDQIVTENY